jgi:Cu-processing system ATP-binding protein
MIQVKDLHKKFGKLSVLDGVSFSIDKPGIFAILGPNGSGKTTLLKSVLGMVLPQSGEITVDGEPILKKWSYRKRIGYLPQIAQFPENLTVQEIIEMIKNIRAEPVNEQVLIDRFGLSSYLEKKLSTLSGGTRQKVNLVLTFMFDCPLYILDEPTVGLDPVALIQLKELVGDLKTQGKTILITSHIMNLVEELADEIVFLMEGTIYFQGTIDALKTKTKQADLEHAIARILR